MTSKVTLQRSLRSRRSVKDLPEHFVKHVMELNSSCDSGSMYYYVYILTNRSKTLYTGITNNLLRRLHEHRIGKSDFTSRYKIDTLVYYERFGDVRSAIDREKKIKNMHRLDKIKMIVSVNPTWQDLSIDWPL